MTPLLSNRRACRKRWDFRDLACVSVLAAIATLPTRQAQAATQIATVTVSTDLSGADLSPTFCGFSYETHNLFGHGGKYMFDPQNRNLVQILKTLGIKTLRFGGDSVDSVKVPIPNEQDVDHLFTFAKASGVTIIYSFRLKAAADAAVPLAKYIFEKYRPQLDSFLIGNEPEFMFPDYDQFRLVWKPQYDAISKALPDAPIGGPSTGPEDTFALPFLKEFGPTGKLAFLGVHKYYLGRGPEIAKQPSVARENFLSNAIHARYDATYHNVVEPAMAMGVPFRFDETNNSSRGGAKKVSDTYAASLWGLDYLNWWATKHIQGLNLHTGWSAYSSFIPDPDGSGRLNIWPMAYAVLGFTIGAQGKSIPVTVDNPANFNFCAYAFLAKDASYYVTLLNKSHDPAEVTLQMPADCVGGTWQRMDLVAPKGDIALKTGMTLGGAEIKPDGTWMGRARAITMAANKVTLEPASASILRWVPNPDSKTSQSKGSPTPPAAPRP